MFQVSSFLGRTTWRSDEYIKIEWDSARGLNFMYSYMCTKYTCKYIYTCQYICWEARWDLDLTAFFIWHIVFDQKPRRKAKDVDIGRGWLSSDLTSTLHIIANNSHRIHCPVARDGMYDHSTRKCQCSNQYSRFRMGSFWVQCGEEDGKNWKSNKDPADAEYACIDRLLLELLVWYTDKQRLRTQPTVFTDSKYVMW